VLGFEVEVCLPVEQPDGTRFKGDAKLGHSRNEDVRLVTDLRLLPPGDDGGSTAYSNIEFVTEPVSVVGRRAQAGPLVVARQLAEVRRIRDALYHAGAASLDGAADGWDLTASGRTARLAPDNGYAEEAGGQGLGDGLFLHYSIGIPLPSFGLFFDRLRAGGVPANTGNVEKRALHRLTQAQTYAFDLCYPYKRGLGRRADADRLNGYLQLVYLQICAMADYLNDGSGQIKNFTVPLLRCPLADLFEELSQSEQDFLRDRLALDERDDDHAITNLSAYQQITEIADEEVEFQDEGSRQVDDTSPKIELLQYAKTAFDGGERIHQQSVFGGMHEVLPHDEEGVRMIPIELRAFGADRKTWTQVQGDLTDLCSWAEEAYQHADT
jgi:hypothetical protein